MKLSKNEVLEQIMKEDQEFQARLKEDIELTKQAIDFVLSQDRTSGTRALASVILHCYNADEWSFDIRELGLLDIKRQALAWSVMRLRVAGKEPQTILDDPLEIRELMDIYIDLKKTSE